MEQHKEPTESIIVGENTIQKFNPQNSTGFTPEIVYAKPETIVIYPLNSNELKALEDGLNASIQLNFSIALLSIFIATLTTLLTVDFPPEKQKSYIFFLVIAVVSLVLGSILMALWVRSDNKVKLLIKEIKDRVKFN